MTMAQKKGRPEGRPFLDKLVRTTGLASVLRRILGGVGSVVDGVAGVFNGVAGCVEGVVSNVLGGVDVGLGLHLDGVDGAGFVVRSVVLARGQAERQDRNGQGKLLHDRSIPSTVPFSWQLGSACRISRSGQRGGVNGRSEERRVGKSVDV